MDEHFPGMKKRYIETFGLSYECPSPRSAELYEIFDRECEKHGVMHHPDEIFAYLREFSEKSEGEQLSFFDI